MSEFKRQMLGLLEDDLAEKVGRQRAAELMEFIHVLDRHFDSNGKQVTLEMLLAGVETLEKVNPSEYESELVDGLVMKHLAALTQAKQ